MSHATVFVSSCIAALLPRRTGFSMTNVACHCYLVCQLLRPTKAIRSLRSPGTSRERHTKHAEMGGLLGCLPREKRGVSEAPETPRGERRERRAPQVRIESASAPFDADAGEALRGRVRTGPILAPRASPPETATNLRPHACVRYGCTCPWLSLSLSLPPSLSLSPPIHYI